MLRDEGRIDDAAWFLKEGEEIGEELTYVRE